MRISWQRERRLLQLCIFIGGWVPVLVGGFGMIQGVEMLTPLIPSLLDTVSLDSHLRYLSGLLLGIGLGFWSAIPHIEAKGGRIRLLTLIVFIGGLGRLGGLALVGLPSTGMQLALVMELVIAPLLCLWQRTLVRRRPI